MRTCTCRTTRACPKQEPALRAIFNITTPKDHIRLWAIKHPMRCTMQNEPLISRRALGGSAIASTRTAFLLFICSRTGREHTNSLQASLSTSSQAKLVDVKVAKKLANLPTICLVKKTKRGQNMGCGKQTTCHKTNDRDRLPNQQPVHFRKKEQTNREANNFYLKSCPANWVHLMEGGKNSSLSFR